MKGTNKVFVTSTGACVFVFPRAHGWLRAGRRRWSLILVVVAAVVVVDFDAAI